MSQGKHLGFNMVNNREIYEIKSFINDIYVRSNVIKNNFKQLDSQVKKELFNSHCLSLYGCELWDLQSKHIVQLEIAWRKCIRCILKLPYRTRSHLIPNLIKTTDIRNIIENRQMNFMIKGLNHNSHLISFFCKNAMMSNNYFKRNINIILKNNIEFKYTDIFLGNKVKFKISKIYELWRIDMINELLYLRDFHIYDILDLTQINSLIDYICTF